MKTIALLSGGKDSILAVMMAMRYGHEPVVIANMLPQQQDDGDDVYEIDSYMFQTVGHEVMEEVAVCLGLPLRRGTVRRGQSTDQSLMYSEQPNEQDEVEALYRLLKSVMEEFPEVRAVTTGAILSHYQRHRVEFVCRRLGLISLAYLWQRPASEVLDMAKQLRVHAILVKTASLGLLPTKHIGKTLEEMRPVLEELEELYGSHMAGEGGEFETMIINCPLFAREALQISSISCVVVDENPYSPSGHAVLKVQRRPKTEEEMEEDAHVLAQLRGGKLCFPSDRLASLPTSIVQMHASPPSSSSSSSSLKVVHVVEPADFVDAPCAPTKVLEVMMKTTKPSSMDSAASAIMDAIHPHLNGGAARVMVFVHHEHQHALREAVAHLLPQICPPLIIFVATRTAQPERVQIRVEHALSESAQASTLHAQSYTCWAAGEIGPFPQASMMLVRDPTEEDDGRQLLMTSVSGRVPATWATATTTDVVGEWKGGDDASSLAAQFAFALANARAYAGFFSRDVDAGVRGASFFVKDAAHVGLLEQLWAWACPHTPWTSLQPCHVYVVAELQSCGAQVEVLLYF